MTDTAGGPNARRRRRSSSRPGPTSEAAMPAGPRPGPPAVAAPDAALTPGPPAGPSPAPSPTPSGAPPAAPSASPPQKPTNRGKSARRPSSDAGTRDSGERALRDIVGAGRSQLGVSGALRGRDVNRPTPEDLAEAERDTVIVRRHWRPTN